MDRSAGAAGQLRLGVLTPHAAAGPEVEIPAMTSGRVAVEVVRVQPPDTPPGARSTPPATVEALRALTLPSVIDDAAGPFGDGSVDVVAHASTTTAYAVGLESERAMVERLSRRCGVPVVGSGRSAVDALRACDARRVALVHPPWFDDAVDAAGLAFFRRAGFDVTLAKASELPDDTTKIRSELVVDWVLRHVGDAHDTVFMAGTGFRAASAVDELERRTGQTVVAANQALLWSILGVAGSDLAIQDDGRLLRTTPPSTH